MKIELDGQRYYTIDEATDMLTGLKSTTVLSYAQRLNKDNNTSVVYIGKKALISESATTFLLEKQMKDEQKRKARMVTIGGTTYATKQEASEALGVSVPYISGWLKVNEIIDKQNKGEFVKDGLGDVTETMTPVEPPVNEYVTEEPKKFTVEEITTPTVTKPFEGKNILIIGGQPFWARWKTFLKKQGCQFVGFDAKAPNKSVLRSAVRSADYVLVAQNMVSHASYNLGKDLCKETGTPFSLFKNFGNKSMFRELKELKERDIK